MAKIFLPKAVYEVKSEKIIQIVATLVGWVKRNKSDKLPKLLYTISSGEGNIDLNGKFTAPQTDEDKQSVVTVMTTDSSIASVDVTVQIKKEERVKISQRHVTMLSGGEMQFTNIAKFNISPRWEIKDFGRDMGTIDPNSGCYFAPEVIKVAKDVAVVLCDMNTGKKDEVNIFLLPVDLKIGVQPLVHAGPKEIQLNIESHNDLVGLDNFSCKILGSGCGSITDGGVYKPPISVDKSVKVQIEVISKLDETKKEIVEIEVRPELCKKCKTETVENVCPNCNETLTYGAYLKKTGGFK